MTFSQFQLQLALKAHCGRHLHPDRPFYTCLQSSRPPVQVQDKGNRVSELCGSLTLSLPSADAVPGLDEWAGPAAYRRDQVATSTGGQPPERAEA